MTPSSPAQVMIGLDVGTTDVKAAAFGLGSGWRSVAIREYPLLQPAR
jgi:gluconokinase